MTNSEFSDTFTTLLNSYNTQAQFGQQSSQREIVLDEYEKSVLLTQAQDIIVKTYFDANTNSVGQGFDDSTRRQVDFSSLIKVASLTAVEGDVTTFDERGIVYNLPKRIIPIEVPDDDEDEDDDNTGGTTGDNTNTGDTTGGGTTGDTTGGDTDTTPGGTDADTTPTTPDADTTTGEEEGISLLSDDDTTEEATGDVAEGTTEGDSETPGDTSGDATDGGTGDATDTPSDSAGDNGSGSGTSDTPTPTPIVTPGNYITTPEVLFILNEKLIYVPRSSSKPKKEFVIIPINYKEYDREMSKPYAQPLKKQAWRLFQNNVTGFDLKTELIPRWNYRNAVDKNEGSFIYKIRYVKRPQPIILEDLPDGLEIDGETKESSCELHPILHMDILNKAVELAISTRGISSSSSQQK